MQYRDRHEAGRVLAEHLEEFAGRPDVVVLGLARGGLPVAWEVARRLGVPVDVFVVRKLGFPGHEELAMGAIASGGVRVLNPEVIAYGVTREDIERVTERERRELERRERLFRGDRPPVPVERRTVILVDDGLATGSTMRAAARALRQEKAARIIVAVPIAAPSTCAEMEEEADAVVCAATPEPFHAVGMWYDDFSQTTDEEVRQLLESSGPAQERPLREREITVALRPPLLLEGNLAVPDGARGAVLFAHGSGSSRFSPRNRVVAQALQEAGFATLLMDLLTPAEEQAERFTRHLRFDVDLLADRLAGAVQWLSRDPQTRALPVGLFGASTGAAAALVTAAREPDRISAVVSRGGRPDLAGELLREVRAPTLLIVGGADEVVLELNREALAGLRCEKRLEIVAGATHLFEEPGALESVAALAARWFADHAVTPRPWSGEPAAP
jgi:putative phosphoribosyl transferase